MTRWLTPPRIAGAALLVCIAAFVAYVFEIHPLTMESHFNSFADAIDAGVAERGWMPVFVPTDATDLFEQHNLESNRQRGRFEGRPVLDSCSGIGPAQVERGPELESVDWWPRRTDAYPRLGPGFDYYACDRPGSSAEYDKHYVAIGTRGPCTYWWTR
jgi:hypothetical protein